MHLAADTGRVSYRKIVVGRLMAHSLEEYLSQLIIRASASQRTSDILMVVGQKAWSELTPGSQPEAIAPVTEMMTRCVYKANFA